MLVVILANVEHAQILTIEKHMTGLPCLTIDIVARGAEYLMYCRIVYARVGIITTVAHLQRLILVVGLAIKDLSLIHI